MKLTIFTPTYNRAHLLPRVFEGIRKQKNKDFEWLIIDDGSTDNTKEVVAGFQDESDVEIRYIYQENAGKPSAFNNAVKNANGELFFCVDSDDYPAEAAVELILDNWDNEAENVSGIVALKVDTNGTPLCSRIPKDINYTTLYDLMNEEDFCGEVSLVYRTDILKNNLYPIIEGEKFITECVLYDKLDLKYKLKTLDEVLTVCEYQQGGLSDDAYRVMINNPIGYVIYYKNRIDMAVAFRERVAYIIRYHAFRMIAKNTIYKYAGKHRFLTVLLTPSGILLKRYYLRNK